MGKLETAVYASFWNEILERFNAADHVLQDPKMVLSTAVKSLNWNQTVWNKRVYRSVRNVGLNTLDYGKAEDYQMTPRLKFRTQPFIPVIDQFIESLSSRTAAYDAVCERIGFLCHLEDINTTELSEATANLINIYNTDLELSLEE
ncbi:uncharacterized protein [Cherax quadricarinatus]|uniref:uncharacterized protein n=1 Tax=Cherax quadricarinatus TaxID=27406 RepID=UPI00387E2868